MNKIHLLVGGLVGAFAIALAMPAQAQVVGSRHDLTSATGPAASATLTSSTDRVCVFCHTPHGGGNTGAPLWNRGASAAAYTMYNNTYSSTIDMVVAAAPVGVSAACLSCHDGTVSFDSLVNGPTLATGAYDYTSPATNRAYTWSAGDLMAVGPPVLVGTDLTNDHPISITYNPALDTAFQPAATVIATLPLYSGNVECGTCHDPHDNTVPPFLRISNAASALCTTCHIK